jgi:hypothetical protein
VHASRSTQDLERLAGDLRQIGCFRKVKGRLSVLARLNRPLLAHRDLGSQGVDGCQDLVSADSESADELARQLKVPSSIILARGCHEGPRHIHMDRGSPQIGRTKLDEDAQEPISDRYGPVGVTSLRQDLQQHGIHVCSHPQRPRFGSFACSVQGGLGFRQRPVGDRSRCRLDQELGCRLIQPGRLRETNGSNAPLAGQAWPKCLYHLQRPRGERRLFVRQQLAQDGLTGQCMAEPEGRLGIAVIGLDELTVLRPAEDGHYSLIGELERRPSA